jgi:biopolymer transport protein ExbB
MKRFVLFLFLICSVVQAQAAFTYKRALTVDYTKVGGSDATDFTVLVSLSNATLKTVANGGHVQDSNGYDIVFGTTSSCSSLLSWEVERYSASAGTLTAWVKVPTISHTLNTTFYVCYGDSGISSFQGGASSGVWDSGFVAVYHFGDGSTLSYTDSKGGHTLTPTSSPAPAAVAGNVGAGAISFGGGDHSGGGGHFYTNGSSVDTGITDMTFSGDNQGAIEWWANPQYDPGDGYKYQIFGDTAQVLDSFVPYSDTGTCYIGFNNSGDGRVVHYWDSSSAPQNTWSHYVLVWQNGTHAILYRNGTVLDTASANTTAANLASSVNIGKAYWNYLGYVDEFRIHNVVRSADWITASYNSQSNPSTFLAMGSESGGGGGSTVHKRSSMY